MADLQNKIDCIICMDSAKDVSRINGCVHTFCYDCIKNWANVTNLCPVCKAEFKTIIPESSKNKEGNKISKVSVKRKIQRVANDGDQAFLTREMMNFDSPLRQSNRRSSRYDYQYSMEDLFNIYEAAENNRILFEGRLLTNVYGALNRSSRGSEAPRRWRDTRQFISENEDYPEWTGLGDGHLHSRPESQPNFIYRFPNSSSMSSRGVLNQASLERSRRRNLTPNQNHCSNVIVIDDSDDEIPSEISNRREHVEIVDLVNSDSE